MLTNSNLCPNNLFNIHNVTWIIRGVVRPKLINQVQIGIHTILQVRGMSFISYYFLVPLLKIILV